MLNKFILSYAGLMALFLLSVHTVIPCDILSDAGLEILPPRCPIMSVADTLTPPVIIDAPRPQIETMPVAPVIQPVQDKEYLGEFYTTGYYSPLGDQSRYYEGRTYAQDVCKNCGCGGDCFTTASGHTLTAIDELSIIACPSTFDFGERLEIEGLGVVTCRDRGGSIKGRRLDIWNGIGSHGLENIEHAAFKDGLYKVYRLK